MADLGDIGSARVTVELDFQNALQEARRAGDQIPPVELRVDLDQSQVTREVAQKVGAAEKEAGKIDARVDVDRAQATTAVRTALASASAAAGSIPVRVNQASLNAAAAKIRTTIAGSFAAAGRLGAASLFPATLAVGALAFQIKKGADDAKVLSTSLARVDQSVKRFGKTSGVTKRQITQMSAEFETFSSISEESIQGASTALLQFGVVNKKTLPATTRLLLDTAAGMKQVSEDGEISRAFAVKFGRSLQDPTKGLALLARGGVAVSASQKALVKELVKTGKTVEATALVSKILQDQFGGAAAALAKDIPGQLRIARDAFEDARRDIAIRILPSIVPIIKDVSTQIAKALNDNREPIANFITGFVRGAGAVIKFLTTSKGFHNTVKGIAAVIKGVAVGLKGFATSFATAFSAKSGGQAKSFSELVKSIGETVGRLAAEYLPKLGTAIGTVAGFFARHQATFAAVVALFASFKLAGVISTLGFLAEVVVAVGAAFVSVFGAVPLLIAGAIAVFAVLFVKFKVVRDAVKLLGIAILAVIGGPFTMLAAAFVIAYKKSETFRNIVQGALASVGTAFSALLTTVQGWWKSVKGVLDAAVIWISGLGFRIWYALSNISLVDAGKAVMQTFEDGLKAGWEKIKEFIRTIPGWLVKNKGPISADLKLLRPAGLAVMKGFDSGLHERWGKVQGWVKNIGGFFKGAINPSSLNISDVLLGKGSLDDLNRSIKKQLNIPANFDLSAFGGFLHPTSGWTDTLAQGKLIEKLFHVGITSGLRIGAHTENGGISQHALGEALDFGDSRASHDTLTNLARFTSRLVSGIFRQVIWQNSLWQGGTPGHGYVGGHEDHVHLGWQRRAAGGQVRKGQRYQWNERGGETLIPHGNGYVMNAGRTKELVSALKSLAQRPQASSSNNAQIHVHSNAADPAAVGSIVMSNLAGVFSRA